nr:MAG TPA_asm: hypothetical protein [Bacteriophage sp.]
MVFLFIRCDFINIPTWSRFQVGVLVLSFPFYSWR